jgi:uncharacterized protein (DUF1330 family)
MPSYVIVDLEITDPEAFAGYAARVPETIAAHGGRYLVRGAEARTLESDWAPSRMSIIEFPDAEAVQAWYDSEAYQQIAGIRQGASITRAIVADGVTS